MSFGHFVISIALCASFIFAAEKKEAINFDTISKLTPGQVNKERLTRLFGKPDEMVDFKKLPNSKSQKEEWTYKQDGRNRITFTFEATSDSLISWYWNVYKGEPEKDLEATKRKFSGAKWQPETDKWINPHAFPMECFYKDEKQGISLTYNLVRREVSAVSRWNPLRQIASDANENAPEFCLGTACTSAIAAKEFFKDKSIAEYCEKVH